MLITSVEVSNFRSIRGAGLDCESLTTLTGRNGAGKSTFLKALDVFYDVAAPITAEDFFDRDTSVPIEIRVTFGDLSPPEEGEFAPYMRDGTLTVTKRITLQEGGSVEQRYYAAAPQIVEFARIRGLPTKRERLEAWRELVASGALPGLSGSPRSADEVDELMAAYERDHPEGLKPIEREEQFFGPRNIGGGKLDKHTKFVLVPAVREAAEEVGSKKGAIQQILDTLVLRKLAAREDVRAFRQEFESRARELFGAAEKELEGIAASLSSSLEAFAPGASLRLRWRDVSIPEVQPPAARVTVVEDMFEGDIERKGHGLQRALVLTLLRELAMLAPVPSGGAGAAGATGGGPPDGTTRTLEPNLILAIEEPELFLHPSRCRYLHRLLTDLTAPDKVPRNQVIYTTHSPHFVALRSFDQIRRIEKVRAAGGSGAPETTVRRFSLQEAAQRLAEICEADPSSFTRESFAARALPLMTHTVSEGFFADVVVLVEGPSEVAVLLKLQEILGEGWDERGIAVIPVGGKTNLDRPAVIFRGLDIPVYVVFDADRRHLRTKEEEEKTRRANRLCLRLVGVDPADLDDGEFPGTHVRGTWAVLEDDLEGVLQRELGETELMELIREAAGEVAYEPSKEALKNVQIVARVLDMAYRQGLRTPTLEEIVICIGRLAPR